MFTDFPTIRLGRVLDARELSEKQQNDRVQLSYKQANKLIEYLIENSSKYSRDIVDSIGKSLNHDLKPDPFFEKSFIDKYTMSSASRTSKLMSAVDMGDMLIRYNGFHFLIRTSFTFCANYSKKPAIDSDTFYSKLWLRFIYVGDSEQILGQPLSSSQQSELFGLIKSEAHTMLSVAQEYYQNLIKNQVSKNIVISDVGTINIFSYNLSKNEFDNFKSYWVNNNGQVGSNVELAKKISLGFTQVASSIFDTDVVSKGPDQTLEALRKINSESDNDIVVIDDPDGIEGIYLSDITDAKAIFLGVASQRNIGSAIDINNLSDKSKAILENNSKARASVSPASSSSAILANDLVVAI
ncbi:MAG: hypothetical protein Tsb002_03690 [Wenzhouxiangellaceae bacterium]